MKCFSLILLFYLSVAFVNAEDIPVQADVKVYPYKQQVVSNGDKILIAVDSDLSDIELIKLKGKRIKNSFYILDFIKNPEGKFYEVFVLYPPVAESSKPEVNEKKKGYSFQISDKFQFQYDQNRQTKDYIVVDRPWKEPIKVEPWKYLTGISMGILSVLLLYFFAIKPYRMKAKIRARKKARAMEIISQLDKVKTRDDFERIYQIKDELEKFLEYDSSGFKKFFQKLNEIQYKREWSDEEKLNLEKIYKQIGEVRFKDGV